MPWRSRLSRGPGTSSPFRADVRAPKERRWCVRESTAVLSDRPQPAGLDGSAPSRATEAAAVAATDIAEELGFDRLLAEQRAAWARRWSEGRRRVDGDADLQQAIRFSLFHLMGSVATAARRRSARAG